MKVKSLIFGAATAASLFAGAALADVYMKGEDVAKLIVGNTIEGRYRDCGVGRKDFNEFYATDGMIRGRERQCSQVGQWSKYGGSWAVKDGKFCVTLGSGRPSGCFNYEVDKEGNLHRSNVPGVSDMTFKIYDGNPDHL